MYDTSFEHHPVTVYRPAFWSAKPANSMPYCDGMPKILLMSQPATAPVTYNKNIEDKELYTCSSCSFITIKYSTDQAKATPTIVAAKLAAVADSRSSHHAMLTISSAIRSSSRSNCRFPPSPAPSLSCRCTGCSSGTYDDPALSITISRIYTLHLSGTICTCR